VNKECSISSAHQQNRTLPHLLHVVATRERRGDDVRAMTRWSNSAAPPQRWVAGRLLSVSKCVSWWWLCLSDGNTTLTTLLHTFATDLCHWYTALAAWRMRWINQHTSALDNIRGPHTQAAHTATSVNHHRLVACLEIAEFNGVIRKMSSFTEQNRTNVFFFGVCVLIIPLFHEGRVAVVPAGSWRWRWRWVVVGAPPCGAQRK
jgi:hypothetical protein